MTVRPCGRSKWLWESWQSDRLTPADSFFRVYQRFPPSRVKRKTGAYENPPCFFWFPPNEPSPASPSPNALTGKACLRRPTNGHRQPAAGWSTLVRQARKDLRYLLNRRGKLSYMASPTTLSRTRRQSRRRPGRSSPFFLPSNQETPLLRRDGKLPQKIIATLQKECLAPRLPSTAPPRLMVGCAAGEAHSETAPEEEPSPGSSDNCTPAHPSRFAESRAPRLWVVVAEGVSRSKA